MPRQLDRPITFLETNTEQVELFGFASGTSAVYTCRRPESDSSNEDAAALLPCDDRRGIMALADGFGGQAAGEQASRLALEALADAVQLALVAGSELREGILNGFERANQAVSAIGVGAATTLAVVEIDGRQVRPYHVGDSEILVVGQRGKIKLTTLSHTPAGYAVEAGLLDGQDALHHKERHIVLNMVGSPGMRIDVGSPRVLAFRDTLLVASDGLFDNLHVQEIAEIVRKGPMPEAVRELADRCHQRMTSPTRGQASKPDDLTIIAFRRDTCPPQTIMAERS